MLNLQTRSIDPEFMDDQEFSGEALEESFRFIKGVNLLGGGQRAVCSGLQQALRGHPKRRVLTPGFSEKHTPSPGHVSSRPPLSVLDVGCGIGDMGRGILRWGKMHGFDFHYVGLEPNEQILKLARKLSQGENIRFIQGSLFDPDIPEADLVIISMVLHHLSNADVVAAIKHLSRKSKIALIINDLERSTLSYLICSLLVFSMRDARSRHDALLSIKKGFTLDEMRAFLKQSGLRGNIRKALGWRILSVVPTQK